MKKVHKLLFQSSCERYGVSFNEPLLAQMIQECIVAGRKETGGIVWGKYSDNLDNAFVLGFSKAPSDSKSGGSSFVRGIAGLQQLLLSLWKKTTKEYYLGEWHFHPFSSSEPSSTDIQQMFSHANNHELHCPEPILIIIGGNPRCDWSISITVYTRNGNRYTLVPKDVNRQNQLIVSYEQ